MLIRLDGGITVQNDLLDNPPEQPVCGAVDLQGREAAGATRQLVLQWAESLAQILCMEPLINVIS